jgi:DNA repair exonuclease SbcCD ATPase subunit
MARRALYGALLASLALPACAGLDHPKARRGHAAELEALQAEVEELRAACGREEARRDEIQRVRAENARLEGERTKLRRIVARAADLYGAEERERAERYRREVERLRADLAQAERAFFALESGPDESDTRASAVFELAEARVSVARVEQSGAASETELREPRQKLEEAARQLTLENFGASIFFASRARRLAEALVDISVAAPKP